MLQNGKKWLNQMILHYMANKLEASDIDWGWRQNRQIGGQPLELTVGISGEKN